MRSIWRETARLPSFEKLDGDRKTDVLVIGGGMAGILCIYMLRQAKIDAVLVEAERLCSGVTENTTAKITVQHGLIYDQLIRRFGLQKAEMYLRANTEALERYRVLCREIDCDFEEKDNYVYARQDRIKLEQELVAFQRLGFSALFAERLPLPFPTVGAVKIERQAQFHPLKFASGITQGLPIFEHTKVRELIGMTAVTNGGRITAKHIIVATHFPFLNKHGSYFMKLYQHRSYLLALRNAPDVNGMYVDENSRGLSFRNAGEFLLLGGGGHRTGKRGSAWREPEELARRHFQNAREETRWAAQDCMTLDGVPYIGRYSSSTPNLYVATGFQKWGMTSAMVAATILTDLIQEKPSETAAVFSPSRSMLRSQLAVNLFEATTGLLTPTTKRCPHLGCALKWNPQERSWDCSCHGSRFTQEGHLIDNPATEDWKKS